MKTGALTMLTTLTVVALGARMTSAGLVAYWPLNDGPAGTTANVATEVIDAGLTYADAVANNNAGSWTNDPTRGIVFKTVQDNRLTAGTQGITGDFTWSLWVKILEDNSGTIIGTRYEDSGHWNRLNNDHMNNWADISGFSIATNSPWHHFAVRGTLNPGGSNQTVQVFLDGTLVGTDSATASATFNAALELGGSGKYKADIGGLMSDVAIWNEALSDIRISDLANGGPVNVPAGTFYTQK